MSQTFCTTVPTEALEEAYKALSALAKNTLAACHSSPQPPEDLLDLLAEQASQRADASLAIALALGVPRAQAMADIGLRDPSGLESLADSLLGPVEGPLARAAIGPHKPISGQQLEALRLEAGLGAPPLPWPYGDGWRPDETEPPSFEADLGRLLAALEEVIVMTPEEEAALDEAMANFKASLKGEEGQG